MNTALKKIVAELLPMPFTAKKKQQQQEKYRIPFSTFSFTIKCGSTNQRKYALFGVRTAFVLGFSLCIVVYILHITIRPIFLPFSAEDEIFNEGKS